MRSSQSNPAKHAIHAMNFVFSSLIEIANSIDDPQQMKMVLNDFVDTLEEAKKKGDLKTARYSSQKMGDSLKTLLAVKIRRHASQLACEEKEDVAARLVEATFESALTSHLKNKKIMKVLQGHDVPNQKKLYHLETE